MAQIALPARVVLGHAVQAVRALPVVDAAGIGGGVAVVRAVPAVPVVQRAFAL